MSARKAKTLREGLELPLLQEAVLHKFNNRDRKAAAKNKRRKSKVL